MKDVTFYLLILGLLVTDVLNAAGPQPPDSASPASTLKAMLNPLQAQPHQLHGPATVCVGATRLTEDGFCHSERALALTAGRTPVSVSR
jgi:hypothetical protein